MSWRYSLCSYEREKRGRAREGRPPSRAPLSLLPSSLVPISLLRLSSQKLSLAPTRGHIFSFSQAPLNLTKLTSSSGPTLPPFTESLRLPLGRTSLPLALSDILRLALEKPPFTSSLSPASSTSTPTPTAESPGIPSRSSTPCPEGDQADAIVEICRVAGNMCFDCGESTRVFSVDR